MTDLLLGEPLANRQEQRERVGPLAAIPLLGLDALASVAYGPEAALTVLTPWAGAAASLHLMALMAPLAILLVLLGISYGQTIAAYPGGGGAYTVAKENLGTSAGLLAGAALAIDYVLNVAVATSAAVGALVSIVPRWQPHTLALGLGVLTVLTVVNLRGVRDVGKAWMVPTYMFVVLMLLMIVVGLVQTAQAGGHPTPRVLLPAASPAAASGLSLWLLLRAFGSGCTAMTGVEAVSNAVPIFRHPTIRNARRTLFSIVVVLVAMLLGISALTRVYCIAATAPGQPGYQSVLSLLCAAISGRGMTYHLTMAAVLVTLALSANTSFAGFPRLCRTMALDGFLPESFTVRGRRLVYTRGIVLLAVLSGSLLVVFEGVTDRLIPLFAVGALAAFTLSQAAMVMHWRRTRGRAWRRSMSFNAVGAVATAISVAVVVVSKFREGAWLSVFIIAAFVAVFRRVRAYQVALTQRLGQEVPVDLQGTRAPLVLVPLRRLDRVGAKALRFAVQLSPEVVAVHVRSADERETPLERLWAESVEAPARQAGVSAPRLVTLTSEYRAFLGPVLDYVEAQARQREVVVVVPEIVPRRWYYRFLLSYRATLIKAALLMRGGPNVAMASTPWYE